MTGRNSAPGPSQDFGQAPIQHMQKKRRIRIALLFAVPMMFAILFALDALISRDVANMSPLFPAPPAQQFSIFVAIVALATCSVVTYFSCLLLSRARAVRRAAVNAREGSR